MGLFGFGKKKKSEEEALESDTGAEEILTGNESSDKGEQDSTGIAVSDEAGTEVHTARDDSEETKDASAGETSEDNGAASSLDEAGKTGEVPDSGESADENQPENDQAEKKSFFGRLFSGMTKTRSSLTKSLSRIFSASHIDDDFYDELEETLIMADIGVDTTMETLDELKKKVREQHIKEPGQCHDLLVDIIKEKMQTSEPDYDFENRQTVMFVVGVNGVGKTTTIGKLAAQYKRQGKKVLMAAADTFRAAAIEQLQEWGRRADVPVISQSEGSDPSAVVYDAVAAARARNVDILLIDTAGRLHNKKNLMDELSKMNRIIDKQWPGVNKETMIVLDGATGQNALEQARQFKSVTDLDGIIITKLDGTAKGGIAIAIHSELGVPVKYIGVGEGIDDLQRFDPDAYVRAIFTVEGSDGDQAGGEPVSEEEQ